MNADIHVRPAPTPVTTPIMRPMPEAAEQAVTTELPAEKTVTAPDAALASSMTPRRAPSTQDRQIARTVTIDRDAGSVVFMSIDETTKQIVSQYPEESRLRSRAYLRSLDETRAQQRVATDRTA